MAAMGAADDQRFVRIAAHECAQHLVAHARQRNRAVLLACPGTGHLHPGGIAVGAGCAGATSVLVVFFAAAGKPDLHAAEGVAMDFFLRRTDHGDILQVGARQVDARIVGWDDGHAAPHAGKAVGVAHAALGAGCFQAVVAGLPAVGREQAPRPFVEGGRQVVAGLDPQFGDDEVALRRWMQVDFGMAGDRVPLAHAQLAHAAFTMEGLGLVFVALDAGLAQPAVVVGVVAGVRRLDQVVVQAGRETLAERALVVQARVFTRRRARLAVVPAAARNAAGRQRTQRVQGGDGIALLGGAVAVEAHRAGGVFLQGHGVVEQNQHVRRRVVGPAGNDGPEEPADAAPFPQPAQERRRRLVVLHREFAGRIMLQLAQVVIEGTRRDRIGGAPFLQQDVGDVDFAGIASSLSSGHFPG